MRYFRYENDVEVPFAMTQHGIAEEIGIRRSHVSYILKGMRQKNFIAERTTHVAEQIRKRKVYQLTREGTDYAFNLRDKLEGTTILLKNENGESKEVKLGEVSEIYSKQIPLLHLLSMLSPEGEIPEARIIGYDPDLMKEKDKRGKEVKRAAFIDGLVQPSRVLGRADEESKIRVWLESSLPKVIVLRGIPGIGKTTLVSKLIEDVYRLSGRSLFWHRFHEWDSLLGTLRELAEFMTQLGKNKLGFYLENESKPELDSLSKLMAQELEGSSIIFTFDDLQKINDDLIKFFSMFISLLENPKLEHVKLILLSRTAVKLYDRRDVALKNLVEELELGGLPKAASRKLLNAAPIDDTEFEKIYRFSEGHPLTLELIDIHFSTIADNKKIEFDPGELLKGEHDLNKYLREEIFSGLSAPERKLLDIISVFRYPVSRDVLLVEGDIGHDVLDRLLENSLLKETASGFEAHELIKEYFYRRLSNLDRMKYHTKAAEYYVLNLYEEDLSLNIEAALEAQHHHLLAGNTEDVALLAARFGDELITRGYADELNAVIEKLVPDSINENLYAEIQIHKGHIETVHGEWSKAFDSYQGSLKICEARSDFRGSARALNACGAIYYHRGRWNDAADCYKRGIAIAEKENDDVNCSKLYSNLALVHWSSGELETAKTLLKKSLELSEKLEDDRGIARVQNNLGIIHWEQNKLDEAVAAYEQSLKLSVELDDKKTIATLYNNLGEVFRVKESFAEAERYYQKSLELSGQLGFKWQVAEVNLNLGQLYKENDEERSKKYLNTALDLYRELGAEKEIKRVQILLDS